MESTEPGPVEELSLADLSDCVALSTEAGWNQVEADWRLFFEQGLVWGIRGDGTVMASAALLPYPPETAWVSMVLTAKAARGQGFASRLTATALKECVKLRLVPQLDATPDGARVYRRLGFEKIAQLTRWRRGQQASSATELDASPVSGNSLDRARALDASAVGFPRPGLWAWLSQRGPSLIEGEAFAFSRSGRTAQQIGPLIAPDWPAAEALLSLFLKRFDQDLPLIIDANDEARHLSEFLSAEGFRPQRSFLRMAKGTPPALNPALYFAVAGPELG